MPVRSRILTALAALALATSSAAVMSAASPSTALAAAPLVVIDPGHGGPYSNANANGLKEKNVNLAIGLELRRQLLARGYRVVMTRTTDRAVGLSDRATWNWYSSLGRWGWTKDGHTGFFGGIPKDDLEARADIANRAGADLFVSIHNNGSASRSARGTETYASRKDPLGKALAYRIQRRVVARTGLRNRGVYSVDHYVTRWSNMPAVLVEGAFITNPSDAWRLKQSRFRRRMAVGIAEGIHSWFATDPLSKAVSETSASSAELIAVKSSAASYPGTVTAAVVARADLWADVPGIAAFADVLGAPLLWTGPSGPSSETSSELSRLAPAKVLLVGTSPSIEATLASTIASASGLPTAAIEPLTATDRGSLAVALATSMTASAVAGTPPQAFVVDAHDGAAMRAAAPIAARMHAPLFVAQGGVLSTEAVRFLGEHPSIRSVTLVGPSAGLPWALGAGRQTSRVSGVSLAATAHMLNNRYYTSRARGSLKPLVADADDGAGYLTAARYAARASRPVVPVDDGVLSEYSRLWITNKRPQIASFQLYDTRDEIPTLMGHMLLKADRE